MKRIVILIFLFFSTISIFPKSLSKPLKENLSEKKMYLIIDKHIKSLSKGNFQKGIKKYVPIKDYIFVVTIIGLTNEKINIEQQSYSYHPIMNEEDLNRLVEWYKQYKDQIPRDCFVKWWNYHANQESTWEDLEQAEQCVMKKDIND